VEVLVLAVSHNLCIRLESIPTERQVADGHRRITRRESIFKDQGNKRKSRQDNENFSKSRVSERMNGWSQ
jgi:hypothetical protein